MTSETRYLSTQGYTLNGLSGYLLRITNTTDGLGSAITTSGVPVTVYLGIRVWKRAADGTETEITAGTAIALVSASNTANLSATWAAVFTALNPTDGIVVRVYGDTFTPPTTLLTSVTCVFVTQQLNGLSLDAATWTVYYCLTRRLVEGTYIYIFEFGRVAKPSRIENFTWTPVPVVSAVFNGDGLTFWS